MTSEAPQPQESPQALGSPQTQEVADSNAAPRRGRRRVLWPLWVAALLVPAIVFLVYDVVLPTLELQRIRKVVAEEVKPGDNWEEAAKRLLARGEEPTPPVKAGGSQIGFLPVSRESRIFLQWNLMVVHWMMRLGNGKLGRRLLPLAPYQGVMFDIDTSGTVLYIY